MVTHMSEIPKPGPRRNVLTETRRDEAPAVSKKAKPTLPKNDFVRKPHLTHRPFVNPSIVSLRDGLQRRVNIKKN